MTVTFSPKGLLIAAVFLVMFGSTLALATGAREGLAAAGLLSVLAYLVIELGVTVNAAAWWRHDRS